MKKKATFLFSAVFCLSVIISGWSTAFAASETIELSLAHTIPAEIPYGELVRKWADKVEKRTDNRVEINIFWGESLLKASELYRGVQTGQADIAYYCPGIDYGLMPLNMYTTLAFMGYPSMQAGTAIYKEIRNKFPEIGKEFKKVKVYGPAMSPPIHLHFTSETVRVPSDLKGMKMISVGGTMSDEMALMGAAPMDVKVGDLYMSLERGLADGVSIHFPVVHGFGILELLEYHTVFPGGSNIMSVDMFLFNQNTWESLPDDVKDVFLELESWYSQEVMKMNQGYINMIKGKAKEMGHKFYEPTAEEMELWKKAVKPSHEKWIENTEEKGLPAEAVYEEVKRLIKESKE